MDRVQMAGLERPAFKTETADDLRELIGQAELIVANLRGAAMRVEKLLFLLDSMRALLARLQQTPVDLRAEATRIEDVERQLLAKDAVLVREMGRLGGLAKVRQALKPAQEQWWWYLDQRVAERRQRQLRRALFVAAGALAVLLIASLAYTYVFPPDPRRLAAMDKASRAEQALQQGDVAGALGLYRQAVEITPEDPELYVWVGVLEEQQGNAGDAAQAYAAAEQLVGNRAPFLVSRGMTRMRLGALDPAEADAQEALSLEPDSAEAYFLLGNVYEARGEAIKAMQAFEKTADLAGKKDNSALIVLARTRLGMLLQSAPLMTEPTVTATPATAP